jgi:hypothetical protein
MTGNAAYRKECRRSHRRLGMYLAMTAWVRKVDCVVLSRETLLLYLGLESMRKKRVAWLKKDLRRWFPHVEDLIEKPEKHSSLYLSRAPFPARCFESWISDEKRIERMDNDGLKAALVEIPDEVEIVSLMALTVQGIQAFPSGNKLSRNLLICK